MDAAAFLMLAFAPGLFWLWYFARKDVYRPAPRRLLAMTFFLGMAATIPAAAMEWLLMDDPGAGAARDGDLATAAYAMLLVVGPVEEISKFLAVRLGPYRSLYFEEPMDGLVYSAAASLGFASLENLFYMAQYGPAVMLVRAPLSTVAHAAFGAMWGYPLGLQRRHRLAGPLLVGAGLAIAATAHGLFNMAAMAQPLLAAPIALAAVAWTLSRFEWARRASPFRYRRNYPQVQCPSCERLVHVPSRYCRYCGAPLSGTARPLTCSHCGVVNRPGASYCTTCGDRLLE